MIDATNFHPRDLICLSSWAFLIMTQQLQTAKFIHNNENEVLKAKLVAWQTSEKNIRSCIVKDREYNGRFVCTVYGLSGKITDKTQIKEKGGYIVTSVFRALSSSPILCAFVCAPTVRLLNSISAFENGLKYFSSKINK